MALSCPAATNNSTWLVHFRAMPDGAAPRYLQLTDHQAPMASASAAGTSHRKEPHMKQTHKAKRHRGSAGGRQEPLAVEPRDPDIVHAHRIAHRSSRPGT